MIDAGSEHQDLLQFLYSVPVGLIHASLDGDIAMINSAAARWLLPLSPDARLENLFKVLAAAAPELADAVRRHGRQSGVVASRRIEVLGSRRRPDAPEFIALTLTKLDDGRLMAVIDDATQQVRDERALKDSAAHYSAVVSVLTEGIVVHDAEGALLMCNHAAERIFGTPEKASADGTHSITGWSPRRPDGEPMSAEETPTGIVLAGGPAQTRAPVFSIADDGERRWFDVSAQPVIRPGTGTLLAVVTSFTDVTQRQRLLEQLQHHRDHLQELVALRTRELEATNQALANQQALLRTVANAVPGMIGYWDADLRCRFSNKAYIEWFGKAPETMVGMRMQDLMGEELFAQNRMHIEAALQGQSQHFQRTLHKPDGTIGHTLASYIPDIVDGRVHGINVVVSDVTELKQAEVRLASLNAQLALRARRADEATRAKSAFLANMSHEIRTPMNAIIGLAHLIQRDTRDPVQRARLGKISDASQHLLEIINDVLDLSKIEAGKMSLDEGEFVADDLLARAVGMVSAQARDKSLEIVLECGALPRRLLGDSVRLSQCLINLLTNAVKFTDAGWIRLRADVQAEDGRRVQVRFEVEDSGPGIVADRQGALFTAFEQADNSATRQHGGTGLGLALTRHFARMMGGDAGVRSEPGAGATFWFTAWLGVVPEPRDAAASASLRGLRALLVDDLPLALQAATRALEMLGLDVDAEPGAALALRSLDARIAQGRSYDVVIVDAGMAPSDGHEALRQMRARLGAAMPPCILMTTSGEAASERAGHDASVDAVLVKPFTPSVLHETLARLLRGGRSVPAMRRDGANDDEARLKRDHAGRSVLLVEDNPINRELAVELLTGVGLVVATSADGMQAVEMTRSRRFDLILMDMQMPVMDGIGATRLIRQRDGPRTPILAMTANAFADDRAACLVAGMDDHLAKPVDPEALYRALLRWLPRAGTPAANDGPGGGGDPAEPPRAQAETLAQRLARVPGYDVEVGRASVLGDPVRWARILEAFIDLYRDGDPALRDAVGRGDRQAIRQAAHSIRGGAATLGAVAVAASAQSLEAAADTHDLDAVRHQAQALVDALQSLAAAIALALRP